jgi:hypothetical protein
MFWHGPSQRIDGGQFDRSAKAVMLGTLESDVATSIAVIDRLPASERADWLDRLSRANYRLVLGPGLPGMRTCRTVAPRSPTRSKKPSDTGFHCASNPFRAPICGFRDI